jgi:VanZ family protein
LWPALLASAICVASGGQVAESDVVGFDKLAHAALFGLLATLVLRNGFAPRRAWIAVAVVSAFGAADEWHQSLTPGRAVELADWIADTLGATVAVGAYVLWPWYRRQLERGLKSRVEKSGALPPNRDPA